jgi:hypothetical protein
VTMLHPRAFDMVDLFFFFVVVNCVFLVMQCHRDDSCSNTISNTSKSNNRGEYEVVRFVHG